MTMGPLSAPSLDEATAVRFGRYEAIQTLGVGGMATVFLALLRGEGPDGHRLVALKQSHAGISRSAQWNDALREAHCGKSIRHANVVAVLEVGDGAQGPYIVMEYVEGGSLLVLLTEPVGGGRAARLPLSVALRTVVDSLRGLHAAHEACDPTGAPLGLVHSDVSPHNLIVGTDGVTRLADFGIARLVQLSNPSPGVQRGKVGYVAPEQAAGRAPDRRSDIFAMGVVMWEIITGRRLFKGPSVDESLRRVVQQPAPPLHELIPDVPRAISDLCAWALAKDPAARPQTANQLADELERHAEFHGLLAGYPEVAGEVATRLRGKLVRRNALVQDWLTAAGFSPEIVTSRLGSQHGEPKLVAGPDPFDDLSAVRPRAQHPQLTRVASGHDWVAFVPPRGQSPDVPGVTTSPDVRGRPTSQVVAPPPVRVHLPWVAVAMVCIAAAWAFGYLCADHAHDSVIFQRLMASLGVASSGKL